VVVATAFWGFIAVAPAAAATVSLAWEASVSPEVTGYQVCVSLTPTCAGGVASIGNRLLWTFQGLADNRQYYFFVRAVTPTEASAWAQLPYATPLLPAAGSEQTRSDFNGDALADILWQNSATNQLATWHLNGPTFLTSRVLSNSIAPGWKAVGSGDLNQDGKPDLIWKNQAAGDLAYWLMDGTLMYGSGGFSFPRVDPSWNLVSVRDMNRDGRPDFVWHNLVNGQLAVWYMSGAAVLQAVSMNPAQVGDTNWKPQGTGDFTGDGWPDLVWRNEATGQLVLWQMIGHTFVAAHAFNPSAVPLTWKIGAVEDANRDGWLDIVWQNETTGQMAIWVMLGMNIGTVLPLNVTLSDPNWKMVGPR
jgi:hypothetical protein